MKTFLLLLVASSVALAEDPKPTATPVPAATPFILPSDRVKTLEERLAEREEAHKKAMEILDAVQKRRDAAALEAIARALENRR